MPRVGVNEAFDSAVEFDRCGSQIKEVKLLNWIICLSFGNSKDSLKIDSSRLIRY